MRSFGFVVAFVGGLVIYLGINSKVAPFFSALVTGKAPTAGAGSSSTIGTSANPSTPDATPVMADSIMKYR